MSGVGCSNGVVFSRGAVPTNLIASISPADTSQATPGAVVLTASASGGTGASSWAWDATYADGTSALGLLSGSGSTRTLTTTAYHQSVRVVATATDAAGQTADGSAAVAVGAPAALVSGGNLTATQLASGTTSQAFTFAAATGGAGTITYSLAIASLTGTPTLSVSTGRSATINGLTDEDVVQVTLTATDSIGQFVTATGVWGVDVVPAYTPPVPETVVDEIDFRTLGTASATGAATTVVGGRSLVTTVVSSATSTSLTVDSNGATIASADGTSGRGYALTVALPLAVTSFGQTEDAILDIVFKVQAGALPLNAAINVGVGNSTHYSNGTTYHIQVLGGSSSSTASINLRRYVGSASTSTLANNQSPAGKTYAVQVVISGGQIGYGGISESSDYLTTPRPQSSPAASGTWAGTIGGSAVSIGAAESRLFSPFNVLIGVASGAISATIVKARVVRRARS